MHSTTKLGELHPGAALADLDRPGGGELPEQWGQYVEHFAQWTAFWTLTFEQADRTHDVTRVEALYKWRRLVQHLNTDLFGHHYTRITGHSYFAYALAFEPHKSGLLHMHALTDCRTHWALAKEFWQGSVRPYHIGILEIRRVTDLGHDARYLTKYVTKGGDVTLYKPGKHKLPTFQPLWFQTAATQGQDAIKG